MPRKTEAAALYLAALIAVVIGALAFTNHTIPAELPVALIALVTASAGIAQPPAVNALLERLAAGLTPTAEPDPAVQQIVAQAIADRMHAQQQPAAAPAPAPAQGAQP